MDMIKVRTHCRSCWANCGVIIRVENGGQITGVTGDKDHPRSRGYICAKGAQLVWGHNRPDRLNSYGNVFRARDEDFPALRVAISDAAIFAIADGALALVRSLHGEITVRARIDLRLRPGVVSLSHGWHPANATRLTDSRIVDPLTTQPQMSAIPVAIAPAP